MTYSHDHYAETALIEHSRLQRLAFALFDQPTAKGKTTMTSIYDQHAAAFTNVSAYVILKDGERVATIAFKFPKDGAGRLWAYVHWMGLPMARGFAGGCGYDKRTAACAKAVLSHQGCQLPGGESDPQIASRMAFVAALMIDGGYSWDRELEKVGFTVLQAV